MRFDLEQEVGQVKEVVKQLDNSGIADNRVGILRQADWKGTPLVEKKKGWQY